MNKKGRQLLRQNSVPHSKNPGFAHAAKPDSVFYTRRPATASDLSWSRTDGIVNILCEKENPKR